MSVWAEGPLVPSWPPPPKPHRYCGECTRLDEERIYCESIQDGSGVTDARVLLRRHLAAAHGHTGRPAPLQAPVSGLPRAARRG